jgi:hypothetical protein
MTPTVAPGDGLSHPFASLPIVWFLTDQEFEMSNPSDTNSDTNSNDLQGEGNYEATRRYDKAAKDFAESGKVDDAARAAKPASPEEAEEMNQAERTGKSHSKGEDPAITSPKPGGEK